MTTTDIRTMLNPRCLQLNKILPQLGDLKTPYTVNCVVMSLLSVSAVIGNVLILLSIWRAPRSLRQPSFFLLVNLAVADLCVGLLAEPVYLVYKIPFILKRSSMMSCYAGVAFNFILYHLTTMSLSSASAISLDRLLALHLHMKYYTTMTRSRILAFIIILWVLGLLLASMFTWEVDAQNTAFVCAVLIALTISLLSYTRILQIVRYHKRKIHSQITEISFVKQYENESRESSCVEHGAHAQPKLKSCVSTVTQHKKEQTAQSGQKTDLLHSQAGR